MYIVIVGRGTMENQKSLNEQEIMDHQKPWNDDHITVEFLGFDPQDRRARFRVDEKHDKVGFYYIEIHFNSSDSTRFDYDGSSPKRPRQLHARTSHADDSVKGIKVVRVRD